MLMYFQLAVKWEIKLNLLHITRSLRMKSESNSLCSLQENLLKQRRLTSVSCSKVWLYKLLSCFFSTVVFCSLVCIGCCSLRGTVLPRVLSKARFPPKRYRLRCVACVAFGWKPGSTQALALESSQSWLPLLRPSILLAASSSQ